MRNDWNSPKIIIGNTATGDFYFPRPEIEANIWEEIEKGNHVLIAAPRRVGKTSVMLAMTDNCPKNTQCIFKNIEGVQSEEAFYKQFFELIVQCLSKFQKGASWFTKFFKDITIEEVTLEGVKFGDKKPTDYIAEINKILLKLVENNVKVVLLLDELPEILNHLYKKNHKDEAISILTHLRQWRQNKDIRNHFSMVLAGSVGIHHIVKTIEGRTVDINDFGIIDFEALTYEEAKDYISWATKDASVQYDETLQTHLLSKITYFIPYFINLMLDEINKTARKIRNPTITTDNIDKAFDKIVKNSDHFKEWKRRLFDYFPEDEAVFLHETLVYIAHKNHINKRQLYDLALKYNKKTTYMELVQGLEHDGYITAVGENYVFVSPFLKAFWKNDNPIYDGF